MILVNVSSVKKGKSGGSETLASNFIASIKGSCTEIIFVGAGDYLNSLNLPNKNCRSVEINNHILRRLYVEYLLLPYLVFILRPKRVINFSNTCSPIIKKSLNLLILLDANYRYHEGMSKVKRIMLKLYTKFVSKRSDIIVTISGAAASDLKQDIRGPIHVAYLGGSFDSLRITSENPVLNLNKPYVLGLSSLSTNKNIEWLVSNWSFDLPTLVLTGHGSEHFSGKNILGVGYTPNDTLHDLFYHCDVFVFPSIYEGFGIPIVDCMSMNKPLVCSDIPVFREVVGNFGTFFQLGSRESLIKAVKYELGSNRERKVPREYSWDIFTDKIMTLSQH
jgi:glycosyltransferase involved in cell wall biosynthesis